MWSSPKYIAKRRCISRSIGWSWKKMTPCLPSASFSSPTWPLVSGRVRSMLPISAPTCGESGFTVMGTLAILLFEPCAGLADDAGPARDLGADESVELARAHRQGIAAGGLEALEELPVRQHAAGLDAQCINHAGWRAGRRGEAEPRDELVARESLLGE